MSAKKTKPPELIENKTAEQQTGEAAEITIDKTEDILSLLDIYYEEWRHRDTTLWNQVFIFFFAALIVMIFPFIDICNIGSGESELVLLIPKFVFPIIGIVLTTLLYLIGFGYSMRLKAIGDTIEKFFAVLPEQYKRVKLADIAREYRNKPRNIIEIIASTITQKPLSLFVVNVMTVSLLILGLSLLVLSVVS